MSTKALDPVFDAFTLHDQEGIPLTAHLMNAATCGWPVNLAAFACDALDAGWPEEKIYRTIANACSDNSLSFDAAEFRRKLSLLWVAAGRKPDPICWKEMKRHLIEKIT